VFFEKIVFHHMRAAAKLRLARIGLEAFSYRDETGTWPDQLSALSERFGGEVPSDPFTGRGFALERTEQGIRISSAAPVRDDESRDWDEVAWELR
jgi:hypothetical protein